MKYEKFSVMVSSKNNYEMLEGEVFKRINLGEVNFINVDDHSTSSQVERGQLLAERYPIAFLRNRSVGVQHAVGTAIKWLKEHESKRSVEWLIVLQHDIFPFDSSFFENFAIFIDSPGIERFGLIGFNVLDPGQYSQDSAQRVLRGEFAFGAIGMAHLSVKDPVRRVLCQSRSSEILRNDAWKEPFLIEIPYWSGVAVNVEAWLKFVRPTMFYQFHLWAPDIAFQLLINNRPTVVNPSLHLYTDNSLKLKYGIPENSAHGAKAGFKEFFGDYSNFDLWKQRWGWNYENINDRSIEFDVRYKGTLLPRYLSHDINQGPLLTMKDYLEGSHETLLPERFGLERFPPAYQRFVGTESSEKLLLNSRELASLVKTFIFFDDHPTFLEIGSGPGRNLKALFDEFGSCNLIGTDLNRESSMLAADPEFRSKVSILEFDSLYLARKLIIKGIDLLIISDHLMHLPYTSADALISAVCEKWQPHHIILREIRKEFEDRFHPRLFHDYDKFNLNYDIVFEKYSDQDPSYFIRLLKLRNDRGVI